MEREIKFRAKKLDTNEWVYGYYVADPSKSLAIIINGIQKPKIIDVDIKTVGEYLGIKDSLSNELYSDDIIKINQNKVVGHPLDNPFIRIIKWNEKHKEYLLHHCQSKQVESLSCYDNIVKIGNFYDNPELLK